MSSERTPDLIHPPPLATGPPASDPEDACQSCIGPAGEADVHPNVSQMLEGENPACLKDGVGQKRLCSQVLKGPQCGNLMKLYRYPAVLRWRTWYSILLPVQGQLEDHFRKSTGNLWESTTRWADERLLLVPLSVAHQHTCLLSRLCSAAPGSSSA